MVNRNRLPKYSAEVIDENRTVYFYLVQSLDHEENQSIKTFVAPYTAAGRTQNLGRFPVSIGYSLMIVNYFRNDELISIEKSFLELQNIKRNRKKIRLSVPTLPLGSSIYYIGNVSTTYKDPNRLILSVNFIEVLEDSIRANIQNLVLNNSMENIKTLLNQRGLI
jgi:hypothetical protein